MEIYRSLKEIKYCRPSAVALGLFDGLHIGHTVILTKTVAFARERGIAAAVFTFRDHPGNVMAGKTAIPRLLLEEEKLETLSNLGIDYTFDFDFADGFHQMLPEVFAEKLLKKSFLAEAVFSGFNFRFGADASGDTETLIKLGKEFGFKTYVIDPVCVNGRVVSSSLIRDLINEGEIEQAGQMLGYDYALSGSVQEGQNIGHSLGFPTANIFPHSELTLPAFGVYVTETQTDSRIYPSVSNVGVNPTVSENGSAHVETHIIDSNLDLYGKKISVSFKKKLREERRFESREALCHQIGIDVESARNYFTIQNNI